MIPGARALWRLSNPRHRRQRRLRKSYPDQLFQYECCTEMNRYPAVFAFVRDCLAGIAEPHILSFGCSTGEEVLTLRSYFPSAEIVGIDINPRNIAACRRRLRQAGDPQIRFELAGSPEREADAFFDAIFCMAVLRRGELGSTNAARCDHLIRFANFDRAVADLNRCLKPGGLLVIMHSNFRFVDTTTAAEYDAVWALNQRCQPQDTPLFGKDDRRLLAGPYNDVVFRKRFPLCPRAYSVGKAATYTAMCTGFRRYDVDGL